MKVYTISGTETPTYTTYTGCFPNYEGFYNKEIAHTVSYAVTCENCEEARKFNEKCCKEEYLAILELFLI